MKAVGIIAEYNPFHNGHKFHIKKSLEITDSDIAVVVMSGNFVQRGVPAVVNKYIRTKMALAEGAHMVFELPVWYCLSSARDFAYGAVSILNELPFVTSLCFGSECNSIDELVPFAELFANEPNTFRESLQNYLRSGNSFPLAREKAAKEVLHFQGTSPLSEPNNSLGIEYMTSLIQLCSKIKPYTISRMKVSHHSTVSADGFASASAIRNMTDITKRTAVMPAKASKLYEEHLSEVGPIDITDFSDLIYYAVRSGEYNLELIKDITPDLANRIRNLIPEYYDLPQFLELLNTKQYTLTRLQRMLFQTLLGITSEQPKYTLLRLLGLRRDVGPFISDIPHRELLVTSPAKAKETLSKNAIPLLEKDFLAADLYNYIVSKKYKVQMPNEYKHSPIVLS
ncbi:MAG: nucleotidyltransferase family protein [Lachnoclostridium sp.]|nr:nucleotidyltransferase family protein [Lachnoclostridium sp.]